VAKPSDGTSFYEEEFQAAAQDFADGLKYLLRTEAPRPLGSEKVSDEEQALTYDLMRGDPAQLAAFYMEQGASVESAAKHIAKMRKRLGLSG